MNNSSEDQNSFVEKFKPVGDSNNSDKNYNAIKALISLIPTVGSLAVGLLESRIPSPAMERLYIFLGDLAQEFDKLKSKIELVDFESPAFQTAFIHASQIATRTHQEQKLEALRNIILNSSIPKSLEDDILAIFLNWIDYFSELHISTLRHLHYLDSYDPEQLHTYFPMLEEKRPIYNQVLKDLADRGLITLKEKFITEEEDDDIALQSLGIPIPQIPIGSIYSRFKKKGEKEVKMKTFRRQEDIDKLLKNNGSSSQVSKTTELGKQFIKFIEYPFIQTESM
jgi:hypothetical protein